MHLDDGPTTNTASTMSSATATSPVSLTQNAAAVAAAVAASAAGPPPPTPPPPPSQPQSTLVMSEYQDQPDTKEGIEELCPVCGDKVSGYHYGLLTCESCKGFFKRTVQNKKVYTCVAERNCHIDKSQRKRCPFCRFQKCLDVGMKLEAVRADRMRGGRNKFGPMYKRDRARKLQLLRQKQMQQHNRSTCQLNPELAGNGGGNGGNGNGVGAMSTSMANNMAYGPPSGPLYTQQGLPIKQEIQIPQLSSSTASPDSSSSSPLPTPNHHHAHHHLHHPLVMGGSMNAPSPTTLHSPPPNSAEHHKMTTAWVAPGTPTSSTPSPNNGVVVATNGTGTGCGGTSAASPSGAHSPKVFHYDGAGSVVQLSATTANGNSNGTTPTATATSIVPDKVPAMIRDFQYSLDDKEWQSQLFGLLQSQTYNQCEVDLFELMCKVLDQSLFAQVDWARNSTFFKDLKVDDQMKLLQYSWSDMLILDHIHHRLHNSLPEETTLANGQKFDLLTLAVLGLPNLVEQFTELSNKMQELKLDGSDYVCLKFLLLLNPDVRGLINRKHVQEAHEQVKQALLDYSLNCYQQVKDKFSKMLRLLPEVHMLSLRGEEYLYYKHLSGNAPTQTLLMEMLHAKKK